MIQKSGSLYLFACQMCPGYQELQADYKSARSAWEAHLYKAHRQ